VIKIAHLTPLYFKERSCLGSEERYPINLARGIVESGRGRYAVEVISYDAATRQQTIQPGVTLRLLTAVNGANPWNVTSWELPAALVDADLVHIHQAAVRASEVALLVAKQQRKPVCVTDHGSITSSVGVFHDRLDLPDRIICSSDFGASLLRTATPVDVIKGGVDTAYFIPPARPPARARVLYVGRLLPHKSVDQLILALPPELPLTVCGRPSHSDYYRLLKQLAIGKQVEFILDADEARIRRLYQQALVNVLPTRYEDCYGNLHPAPELMGLTLLEAMACGTPVIGFRAGAMPEFVSHGETGYIFDSRDQLTAQLRYLAGHPDLVEQMGRRARKQVEQEFDYRVVGGRLISVYEGLLSQAQEAAA